ncbi:MAG: ESX secretion-associated protein EspG [Mycobacterium sp.]
MSAEQNAVELTVDQAWFIAETTGAGSFPWVLAITTPYRDAAERSSFLERQKAELTRLGLVSRGGAVNAAVADWIKTVCFPDRWLDLRYIAHPGGPAGRMLRGVVAQRCTAAVVALRSAGLVTFTAMEIDDPQAMVGVLGAGLAQRPPARFDEFTLPMRVGARADERLRAGAAPTDVIDHLGVPESARVVLEAVFAGPRSYVEAVAGQRRDGHEATTDVGLSIVDTVAGRILISPSRGFDGEWISTFCPGTPSAVAAAIEQLTALLPDSQWFTAQKV